MDRIYSAVIKQHFEKYEQMAFLSGPRQVGKTTVAEFCQSLSPYHKYLNWDFLEDRAQILKGYSAICEGLPLAGAITQKPILVFDELHKYKDWKNFIKGFIDYFKGQLNILVTGSARLDIYRKGGDSLMGRYFLYREHPLSVGELLHTDISQKIIRDPQPISDESFDALLNFGGFPEPFLKKEQAFSIQWQRLRRQQLFQEDIRDIANVRELAQLELLASILREQTGQLVNYSNLAKHIRVSDNTIRLWMNMLESFYYSFSIKPWSTNIARSLIKQPKTYLWDWSIIQDKGQRAENFIAAHLLKAVHYWTDLGFGEFDLWFLRDKDKNEVDFLITQNNNPWLLVEVKSSYKNGLTPALNRFQKQIRAEHVLQVAMDMPYEPVNCFDQKKPLIVPARTFLSQLI